MPLPEIEQLSEYRKRVESGLGQLKSKLLDLRDRGDEAGMKNVGKQIRLLQSEQAQAQEREYDQRLMRKQELMDELASYEGAGYKAYEVAGTPATGVGFGSMSVMPTKRVEYRIGKEGRKTLQSKLAELLDVDPNKINIDKGLSFDEMAAAEVMTTPEGKEGVLARFGDERISDVIPVQIAGRENFLIKNPDDNYFLAYTDQNKGDQMLAKLLAGAFPVTSSLLGVTGAGSTIAQSGKTGLVAQSLGGSGGISLGSIAQEEIMGQLYGAPTPGIGERAKQIAGEALIGLAADVPLAGLGRLVTTMRTATIKNQVDAGLEQAVKDINKSNKAIIGKQAQELKMPTGAGAGEKGLVFARELAGAYPQSRYYRNVVEPTMEQLTMFQKAMTGDPPAPQEVRDAVFDRVLRKQERLTNVIAGRDHKIKRMLQESFERKRASMMPQSKVSMEQVGQDLQSALAEAQVRGAALKDDAFRGFFDAAENVGIKVKKSDIIATIKEAAGGPRNALKRNAQIDTLVKNLEEIPDESVSLEFLRNSVQVARDSVPENATKTAQQVAVGVSEALDKKFKQTVADNGLTQSWQNTLTTYNEAYQSFRRGSPGMMLKEKFGDFIKQPTKAINAILNDPKDVRDVLVAFRNTGDEQAELVMRQNLQNAYLEKIGLKSSQGKAIGGLREFKDDIIDELWGDAAPRIKQSLKEVNEAFASSNTPLSEITASQADQLLKPLAKQDREALVGELVKRNKAIAAQDALRRNSIVEKFLKKGKWDEIDSSSLADTLLHHNPSDVKSVYKNIPAKSKKSVQQDFAAEFFGKYSTEKEAIFQPATGDNLWNGEKVIKDLKGWTRKQGNKGKPIWVANMDTVLGPRMTDLIIANSRMSAATRPLMKDEALKLRALTSFDGIKVYGAGLVESAKNRFLASALGSNRLEPYLRSRLRRSADVERNFERMVRGVLGTRIGIQAAAQQSSNDPDYAAALNEVFADIARQETEE
ncbi:hypothetical protein [Vulcanococcus sp.]|uniref:hypothetical protein n=1 Tax=Vulcanococcus sp. TaxID=2856995 RepID=UPI003F698674